MTDLTAISRPVRVPKTAEVVARTIRNRIVRGELAEGDNLPAEAELMQQFRISRPTLREAFRILESESLIDIRRGARDGARVLAPSREVAARYAGLMLQADGATLSDVYEARMLLFPAGAALWAKSHCDADIDDLRGFVDEIEAAADDPATFIRKSANFNLRIAELSGNRTLALLTGILDDIVEHADAVVASDWSSRPQARSQRVDMVVTSMRHLIDLIAAGDAAGAEAYWRESMDISRRHTLRIVGAKTVLDLLE